jgi:hypothetical protein
LLFAEEDRGVLLREEQSESWLTMSSLMSWEAGKKNMSKTRNGTYWVYRSFFRRKENIMTFLNVRCIFSFPWLSGSRLDYSNE